MGTCIRNSDMPTERSPSGLPLRHLVTEATGADSLYVGEQWLLAGERVLLHRHAVEEVLIFIGGEGEIQLGEDRMPISAGVTVHIPPAELHGFWNTGDEALRLYVLFPGATFADTVIAER